MRKYIFAVLFFLGCFFVSFTTSDYIVKADSSVTTTSDAYDSRKITIMINNLHPITDAVVIHEIEYCELQQEGCNTYSVGTKSLNFKIISSLEYQVTVDNNNSTSIVYEITSSGDGVKNYYMEPFIDGNPNAAYSCVFTHTLSTLNERIVINPDGNGKPLHVYDNVQYSPISNLTFRVNLLDEELNDTYSGIIYVCEEDGLCSDYLASDGDFIFSISTYGDGVKKLNIYLVKKNNQILSKGSEGLETELKTKSVLVSKNIYLDTIGPEIILEGGNWIYVEAGQKYSKQEATCKDAVFEADSCSVSNDLDLVEIRYDIDEVQIVTYEATDRLGNVKTTAVYIRVAVDHASGNENLILYLGLSGGVLLVTGIILTYVLIKNNEKKKKISYI